MKIREVSPNLFQVSYQSQRKLAHTFLRFQEHYESPRRAFTRRGFSRSEFKNWYSKSRDGRFTYYSDWSGFNLPGRVLNLFYRGDFKNLTTEERRILKCFQGRDLAKLYVIGTSSDNGHEAMKHEVAHGLFYLDAEYRKKVTRLILANEQNLGELKKFLRRVGYADSVWIDEAHAYLLCEEGTLSDENVKVPREKRLRAVLERYFKKHSKVKVKG